ncbi:MAG: hypothetical protein DDT29_01896 [Dehalococcoidia bacterium]|nr:hypothetical protein [Bacillota bacterium]
MLDVERQHVKSPDRQLLQRLNAVDAVPCESTGGNCHPRGINVYPRSYKAANSPTVVLVVVGYKAPRRLMQPEVECFFYLWQRDAALNHEFGVPVIYRVKITVAAAGMRLEF